jgi:hypothetical protein
MRTARWLILGGSIVFFAAAVLHAAGYREVTEAVQATVAKPFVLGAFKAVWLMVFVNQLILGVLLVAASRIAGAKRIVLLATMIPLADTALLFYFVGIFVGTISLAFSTVLFLVGAWLLPNAANT